MLPSSKVSTPAFLAFSIDRRRERRLLFSRKKDSQVSTIRSPPRTIRRISFSRFCSPAQVGGGDATRKRKLLEKQKAKSACGSMVQCRFPKGHLSQPSEWATGPDTGLRAVASAKV